jgi:hypothetical protein
MERLARSDNLYARVNLVLYNPSTPRALLERLAQDREAMVAERARQRLRNP